MKHEEKKKQMYVLMILRRDNDHIIVSESQDYDKTYEQYTEIVTKWTQCIKDNIPFSITSPIVTCFDPGLIYEIKINPVVETTATKYDNPYAREMNQRGLAAMQNFSENLDQGYR